MYEKQRITKSFSRRNVKFIKEKFKALGYLS